MYTKVYVYTIEHISAEQNEMSWQCLKIAIAHVNMLEI